MRIKPDDCDEDEPDDIDEYYELDEATKKRMWRNIELAILLSDPEFLSAMEWEIDLDQ